MQISSLFCEFISIKTTIYSIVIFSCCKIHQVQSSIAFEHSGMHLLLLFGTPFRLLLFWGAAPTQLLFILLRSKTIN